MSAESEQQKILTILRKGGVSQRSGADVLVYDERTIEEIMKERNRAIEAALLGGNLPAERAAFDELVYGD